MSDPATAARVRRAQAGDTSALEEILREYRPRVLRFALARLGDVHAAEDVTQEVCVALLKGLATFEPHGRLQSFVFAIAHHKIVDAVRAGVRAGLPVDVDVLNDHASTETGPEELTVAAGQVRALVGRMDALSERDRSILLMRVVGGLSAGEVADVLNASPGAIRVAQHRALKLLRAELGGDAAREQF